jgi:hypothetical protein
LRRKRTCWKGWDKNRRKKAEKDGGEAGIRTEGRNCTDAGCFLCCFYFNVYIKAKANLAPTLFKYQLFLCVCKSLGKLINRLTIISHLFVYIL